MSNNNKKILANLIKADLRDVLTNDSRQGEGYFFDYQAFDDGDIQVFKIKNEELEKALKENFQENIQKRREKFEKGKKKHEIEGKYWPDDVTWQNQEKREIKIIWKEDLDKLDHQEIISLFSQINQLFEDKKKQKWQGLNDKLANNSQLFHGRIDEGRGCTWKVGRYVKFFGKEKGRNYTLAIPVNHSALTKFKDNKVQFYLIKGTAYIPIEKTPSNHWSTGENNLHNFYKFVELKDNITITPYNEESGNGLPKDLDKSVSELKRENGCDTCYKKLTKEQGGSEHFYIMKRPYGKVVNPRGPVVWACQDCYPTKEQEYLQKYSGILERYLDKDGDIDYRWIKEDSPYVMKESDQSGKDNKVVINFLIRYFLEHDIKKITFENNELVITYNNNNNNNEIISQENIGSELQVVKDFFQKNDKREIELEELKNIINTNHYQAEKPKDNTLLIVCGISGILIIGVVIGLLINKKRHKNK